MRGRPFALIGVNSDKDLEEIRDIVVKKELTWRSFQNSPAGGVPISAEWNVSGWPTIFVLDPDRRIQYVGHNGEAAIELVKQLVADAEHK